MVTLPTATTLKIKHDVRKRKLEDDLNNFLRELLRTILNSAPLIVDEPEDNQNKEELSTRGISILRSLAILDGERELVKREEGMEVDETSKEKNTSVWLKVRDKLSRFFG